MNRLRNDDGAQRRRQTSHVLHSVAGVFETPLTEDEREGMRAQIEQDTCTKHNVFCCDKCFDMTVA